MFLVHMYWVSVKAYTRYSLLCVVYELKVENHSESMNKLMSHIVE